MIIIHAIFSVDPVNQQAFVKEIQPLITTSRAEEGNISYDLCKDTEIEERFIMVEVWKDGQSVASHNANGLVASHVSQVSPYLTKPLELKVYNEDL